MLPGAPPDRETLPTRVLCWLLPLPAFVARGQEMARVQAREAETLPTGVPAHGAPWAEHQDLELFLLLFYLFFFFQVNVGRKLNDIPRVGLKGWSEDVGEMSEGL